MKKKKVNIEIDKLKGTFKYVYQPNEEHLTTNRSLDFYLSKINDKLNLVLKAQTQVINKFLLIARQINNQKTKEKNNANKKTKSAKLQGTKKPRVKRTAKSKSSVRRKRTR